MMLADTQPSPQMLSQSLLLVCTLASLGCSIVMIVVSIITVASNKKQKREVTFGFEPASKKEFDEARLTRDQEIKAIYALIERNREAAEKSRSISSAGIYNKIDATRIEIEGRMENNRQELSDRLGSLPGEIVAFLKNTNAI